ncbi:hypothetical protein CDAR_489171 [Caerostris darwini]|uniref:Uncharacterized protein n=1 Tax=Caerostris darwini TaxID=1538125 RepID=A0AAV4SX15_9ARAC|nr:hypothetical protein CDAR_489171 [Caerostris darwini]
MYVFSQFKEKKFNCQDKVPTALSNAFRDVVVQRHKFANIAAVVRAAVSGQNAAVPDEPIGCEWKSCSRNRLIPSLQQGWANYDPRANSGPPEGSTGQRTEF